MGSSPGAGHELLFAQLRALGELDLDACAVDASHVRAFKGETPSARRRSTADVRARASPDLRRRRYPAGGPPTGGNRYDVTQLIPLVDAVPLIRGRRGRPRPRSRELFADRGYDYDICRRRLRQRGITPQIARRGVAHGSGLGKQRWMVERGFDWLHAFRRLRTRYEHRGDIHLGLLQPACALICFQQLAAVLT